MRTIFIGLIFISLSTFSQKQLTLGKVNADKNFCKGEDSHDSSNICNSKNQLEIWFANRSVSISDWDMDYSLIKLQYNESGWKAVKYVYKLTESDSNPYKAIYEIDKEIALKPPTGFENIFSELKQNNIFTLPDQQKLIPDSVMNGGNFYNLTFKARNKFRSYTFFNPERYKEKYETLTELRNYEKIAILFNSLIKE